MTQSQAGMLRLLLLSFLAGLLVAAVLVPRGSNAAPLSFNNQDYPNIGWKNLAVLSTSIPVAHMDNGGAYCGTSLDQAFTDAIVWWNSQGTVASFQFATSTCNPQSFPTVRLVPYTMSNGSESFYGRVALYDRHPSTGVFTYCLVSCNYGENPGNGAQTGYDLGEVLFNEAHDNNYDTLDWEWVSKHELGHVLGLADQYTGMSCNPNYIGLMDQYLCHSSLTPAEKDSVDEVHGF